MQNSSSKEFKKKIPGWKSCFDKVADSNNSQGSQEYICAEPCAKCKGKHLCECLVFNKVWVLKMLKDFLVNTCLKISFL